MKIRHLSLLRLTLQKPNFTHSRLLSSAVSSTTKSNPSTTPSPSFSPSPNVNAIVDEVSKLTLLELSSLTHLLVPRLDLPHLPTLAVIPAGMSFSGAGATAASPAAGENAEEEKKEKTAFDVKLEGFDASAKIKVIKEVRGFTDLGLKEAKELVEKAPVVVKGGVSKEEAEKILEKLKAIGAKVALE